MRMIACSVMLMLLTSVAYPQELTPGQRAAKANQEEYKAKRKRQAQMRRLQLEAEQVQQQQRLQYYQNFVVPQQQAQAQKNFNNYLQYNEMIQRDEMIQIQRNRNFLLQQQIWNQQLRNGRQPIYYGVPPYGIDLRYP